MSKRLVIQLYGHVRSFMITYPYFRKNIVEALEKQGMLVDVFIHTWNELEHTTGVPHYTPDKHRRGKPLLQKHIEFIETNYRPKGFLIECQRILNAKEQEIVASNGVDGKISNL